jgi:hypothetical protein
VQELGPARAHLAQADLAFARAQNPTTDFGERREQRGAAVVIGFQQYGGAAGQTDPIAVDSALR